MSLEDFTRGFLGMPASPSDLGNVDFMLGLGERHRRQQEQQREQEIQEREKQFANLKNWSDLSSSEKACKIGLLSLILVSTPILIWGALSSKESGTHSTKQQGISIRDETTVPKRQLSTIFNFFMPYDKSPDIGAEALKGVKTFTVEIGERQQKYTVSARALEKGNVVQANLLLKNHDCFVRRDKLIPVVGHTELALVKEPEKAGVAGTPYYVVPRNKLRKATDEDRKKNDPEKIEVGLVNKNLNISWGKIDLNTSWDYIVSSTDLTQITNNSDYQLIIFKTPVDSWGDERSYALVKRNDILNPKDMPPLVKIMVKGVSFLVPRSELQPIRDIPNQKRISTLQLPVDITARNKPALSHPKGISKHAQAWRQQCRA